MEVAYSLSVTFILYVDVNIIRKSSIIITVLNHQNK